MKTNTCETCIHFGELRATAGKKLGHVCLAPVTTERNTDLETRAKNPFVYETEFWATCELWTENKIATLVQ